MLYVSNDSMNWYLCQASRQTKAVKSLKVIAAPCCSCTLLERWRRALQGLFPHGSAKRPQCGTELYSVDGLWMSSISGPVCQNLACCSWQLKTCLRSSQHVYRKVRKGLFIPACSKNKHSFLCLTKEVWKMECWDSKFKQCSICIIFFFLLFTGIFQLSLIIKGVVHLKIILI